MVKYEDECVGCTSMGLYCLGSACSKKNVPHWYCNKCDEEFNPDELYVVDGEHLCEECLLEHFPKVSEKF